jgi:hypothetical protein
MERGRKGRGKEKGRRGEGEGRERKAQGQSEGKEEEEEGVVGLVAFKPIIIASTQSVFRWLVKSLKVRSSTENFSTPTSDFLATALNCD